MKAKNHLPCQRKIFSTSKRISLSVKKNSIESSWKSREYRLTAITLVRLESGRGRTNIFHFDARIINALRTKQWIRRMSISTDTSRFEIRIINYISEELCCANNEQ